MDIFRAFSAPTNAWKSERHDLHDHRLNLYRTRRNPLLRACTYVRQFRPHWQQDNRLSSLRFTHHTTMADDTRQPEEQVAPRPRAPANVMPGGTAHTAGGEKLDSAGPSYIDAVRSLGPEYYMNFHKRPCVRDSQLQGIAAGFAGGSLAGILGSTDIWRGPRGLFVRSSG